MQNNFPENFREAYRNLYALHPPASNTEFKFRYLNVSWFFPNHLHNVLYNVKKLAPQYFDESIDVGAALYGALMHDAGLVYKRESSDPKGHENRSVEYAEEQLRKLGYDNVFINKVAECIKATEPDYDSDLPEAVLVKNADAYAHLISMHFFAKANFANDIHEYVNWFAKKVETSFAKLTMPELQKELEPLVFSYRKMVENYRANKEDDFLKKIV
jgi:hypothetical protein